tara:strand:+ start:6470 stop:7360 length:891 start_codon:yes stop_codon:yes gene_type:complete
MELKKFAINNNMIKASPFVKKISKEQNIDITKITGSGPNGRIIKRDLINNDLISIKSQNNLTTQKEIIPSQMRKIIAERTTEAFKNIPHFYLKIESKIDKIKNLRDKINNLNIKNKISLNDLFIKALALSQKKNPKTCAHWINGKIIQNNNIDIAVAVALEDGLITPIIKNANKKGLIEISNEMKTLIQKAKNGKLQPEEYTGGTITISNLGMYGITEFGAIINPPQSCILAIGAAKEEPTIINNEIKKATILRSTLSADHRILDGSIAANLLKDFNDILENPFEIWLNSKDMKLN